jgi:hypothetical protein
MNNQISGSASTTSALRIRDYTISGAVNNLVIPEHADVIRLVSSGGACSITGIAYGYAGRRVFLIVKSDTSWTYPTVSVVQESGSSSPANRILFGTGTVSVDIAAGGAVELMWDSDITRWVVIAGGSTSGGAAGAPVDATYIVASSNADLTNELVATDTTSIDYVTSGATATWQRKALTGAITAAQDSNATVLGSFTKAQLDTAVSDGDVLYVGDVTQYTDEMAQDAIGAMVDTSLVYVDATPLLQRAALTGDVTAPAGSNATTIAPGAVTYSKIQNVTDARLLGRSAGSSGDVQEITVGTNLSLSSGALTGITHPMTNLFMYLTLRGGL